MNGDAQKLLSIFGLERELKAYLKVFQKSPKGKFAVIKVSGETIDNHLAILAEDLAFLSRLGLYPIVVHGGGKQIDKALKKKGIVPLKIDGERVTDDATLDIVAGELSKITGKIVENINLAGGIAMDANGKHAIKAKLRKIGKDLGNVGDVTRIDGNSLSGICEKGAIPVINSIGYDGSSKLNVNADAVAASLVLALKPSKLIMLTETGGILDSEGKIIPDIELASELGSLLKSGTISGGMLAKVRQINALISKSNDTVVEICSAEALLAELFTFKGRGTLLRYGASFELHDSYSSAGKAKVKAILEDSFQKKLASDYLNSPAEAIITEKDGKAVAIIKRANGVPYLDKFAVIQTEQGNGIGKALWKEIRRLYPGDLVWRASLGNPINPWYFQQCDGCCKSGEWMVFWIGNGAAASNPLAIAVAAIPTTMVATNG